MASHSTSAETIFNAKAKGYTERCGSITTERYRKDMTFTTKTTTGAITKSITWNCL